MRRPETIAIILVLCIGFQTLGCRSPLAEARKRYTPEKGVVDAKRDVEAGFLLIKNGGLPSRTFWKEAEIWKTYYSVELNRCCDRYFGRYAEGYNSVSIPAIQRRYGTNVLEEVHRRARTRVRKGTTNQEVIFHRWPV